MFQYMRKSIIKASAGEDSDEVVKVGSIIYYPSSESTCTKCESTHWKDELGDPSVPIDTEE